MINFKEIFNTHKFQFFIIGILSIIIFFYYKTQLEPFPYAQYDLAINAFQKHDAELNEYVVLTRFGLVKNYDPLVSSLFDLHDTIHSLKTKLRAHPHPTLTKKITILEESLRSKEKMIETFTVLNPVLINAISDFSKLMTQIIDSETQADTVERFSIQDYNPEHYEFLNKLNQLFRDILIYTTKPSIELHQSLSDLLTIIKKNPIEVNHGQEAYGYADIILQYQPKITDNNYALLRLPIITHLDELNTTYTEIHNAYLRYIAIYQYFLYSLSLLLLIIVHLSFKKIRENIKELLIQIKLKILAQEELAQINHQLEQRVLDRTQDLAEKNQVLNETLAALHDTQDQLIMHEKMASVGMLTTGIAHEIKNPLNFINNFSDISSSIATELKTALEQEKAHIPPESYADFYDMSSDLEANCKRIKEYGQRADNIVNNMIMHSQETGTQKESFKFHPLVTNAIDQAIHTYQTVNPHFNIHVETFFDPAIDELVGIPSALIQAFTYILHNAFWAVDEKKSKTPPDSYIPIIKISTQLEKEAIFIKFFDNGTGVPSKNLKKIFEPFFTTKPTGRGNTGLGLSICYDILVKQHGGEFSVTSTENEYAEFLVKIPTHLRVSHQ